MVFVHCVFCYSLVLISVNANTICSCCMFYYFWECYQLNDRVSECKSAAGALWELCEDCTYRGSESAREPLVFSFYNFLNWDESRCFSFHR